MSDIWTTIKQRRNLLSLAAGLALALILLAAGVGKLLAQTEFAGVLLVQTFLPEGIAKLVGYSVPIAEITIGGFLLVGFYPKLMAVLSLPLSFTFMANNVWLLGLGLECPTCPHCFGKLEEIFGPLSTWQALYLDIGMVLLAAIVLIFFPGGFFPSRLWFGKPKQAKTETAN